MGSRRGPRGGTRYSKGAYRPGGRPGGMSSGLDGIAAIRRAYKNAIDDEVTRVRENGPVRQFTPEEIAKLNAESKK